MSQLGHLVHEIVDKGSHETGVSMKEIVGAVLIRGYHHRESSHTLSEAILCELNELVHTGTIRRNTERLSRTYVSCN